MCKSICYAYSCSHKQYFHQSICHGTFTYIPWKKSSIREPKLSCQGWPLVTIASDHLCGPCSREAAQQELDASLSRLIAEHGIPAWGEDEHEEVTRAKERKDQEGFLIMKRYPDATFKKSSRPEKGGRSTRRCITSRRQGSLLQNEVKPEAVLVQDEIPTVAHGWWDDWDASGQEYTKLEDEVAENQAAQEADGIIVSWDPWAGQETVEEDGQYQHWGAEAWAQYEVSSEQAYQEAAGKWDEDDGANDVEATSLRGDEGVAADALNATPRLSGVEEDRISPLHAPAKENQDPHQREERRPQDDRRDSKVAYVQDLSVRASYMKIQE